MRRDIEAAPKDGNVIILEDDTCGTCASLVTGQRSRWPGSAKMRRSSPINPTIGFRCSVPSPQEEAIEQDTSAAAVDFPVIEPPAGATQPSRPAWRRLVVSSIAAAMIASSLIGMYFRASITGYITEYAAYHDNSRIGRIVEQPSNQAAPLPIQEMKQAELSDRRSAVERDKSERTVTWGPGGRRP